MSGSGGRSNVADPQAVGWQKGRRSCGAAAVWGGGEEQSRICLSLVFSCNLISRLDEAES